MSKPEPQPVHGVHIHINKTGHSWTVSPETYHAHPGDTIVIQGPTAVDAHPQPYEIWFDPEKGPHIANPQGRVVLSISPGTPAEPRGTEYKYTIRIYHGSHTHIIDPKIIIKPPY